MIVIWIGGTKMNVHLFLVMIAHNNQISKRFKRLKDCIVICIITIILCAIKFFCLCVVPDAVKKELSIQNIIA